jgi:hypothetical protein
VRLASGHFFNSQGFICFGLGCVSLYHLGRNCRVARINATPELPYLLQSAHAGSFARKAIDATLNSENILPKGEA